MQFQDTILELMLLNLGWTDTPAEDVIQKKFHDGGDDWLEKAEKKYHSKTNKSN